MKILSIRYLRAAVCAAALTGASLSFAQLTLTNTPAWNGSNGIGSFGEPGAATFGQTFTAVAGNTFMNSFTFHLKWNSDGDVKFNAYVSAWDGAKITGPLLYTSVMNTLPVGTSAFQPFTFSTGSLALTAGSQYVAFLSASLHFDSVPDVAVFGWTFTESYSGGNFVWMDNGSNFGALSISSWNPVTNTDLAFTMEFSPAGSGAGVVPEPSTYGLIGAMALLGLVAVRRMRRS